MQAPIAEVKKQSCELVDRVEAGETWSFCGMVDPLRRPRQSALSLPDFEHGNHAQVADGETATS